MREHEVKMIIFSTDDLEESIRFKARPWGCR